MSPRSKQPPQEQARKILVEASPLAARLLLEALQEGAQLLSEEVQGEEL